MQVLPQGCFLIDSSYNLTVRPRRDLSCGRVELLVSSSPQTVTLTDFLLNKGNDLMQELGANNASKMHAVDTERLCLVFFHRMFAHAISLSADPLSKSHKSPSHTRASLEIRSCFCHLAEFRAGRKAFRKLTTDENCALLCP